MGRIGLGATARCLVATTSGLWVGEVITRCASLKAEPQRASAGAQQIVAAWNARLGGKIMECFTRKTSIAGTEISNWVLVLGAIIIIWLVYRLIF
jgi:hypothetical protein